MKFKRILATVLSTALLLSAVPAVGAFAETTAAKDPMDNYVLHTIYETKAATISGSAGAYVYGNLWVTDLSLGCAGVAKKDLALSMRLFYLNTENPTSTALLDEAKAVNSWVFLSTEHNGGKKLNWTMDDLVRTDGQPLKPGEWNDILLPFSTATESGGTFDPATDTLTFFWPEFKGVKENTWLVRMADVNIVDTSRAYVAPEETVYDTTYLVGEIPYTMEKTLAVDGTMAIGKSFTAIDASAHNPAKLALELDITATGDVPGLKGAIGQVELTSSGNPDVEELSYGIGSLDWEVNERTYVVPLSMMSTTGGALDYSAIDYIRLYVSGWNAALTGAVTLKVTGVRLVDLTSAEPTTLLPTLFSDGMMFQQNKPMNVFGYGEAGTEMTAELYKGEDKIETATATVDESGRFDLSFAARAGSYDTYSMRVYGGDLDETIHDILIGELWVAGGQSNMELQIAVDADKNEILSWNNENVRVFWMPTKPSGEVLMDPAKDIKGAYWIDGTDTNVLGSTYVSTLAFVFANRLQEQLDVPVGFLNTSLGATVIEAWLSREAIDGNAKVQAELLKRGLYYDEEFWSSSNGTMATWYNQKIGPLAGINVAGAIWYQGESNSNRSEIYDIELALLKQSWGEIFGYENGDMPFIFTQVAPYRYDNGNSNKQHLGYLAMYMERGWALCDPDTTSMVTIYDLPLDHMREDGVSTSNPIHPRTKLPVGERFAEAAMNMVYGGEEEYTAPVYKSMEIRDGAIYLTFDRVGSGLKSIDGTASLHGFTIAGEDGIYVNAEAEIVDADTVKVWNNRVNDPKNAMYAFDNFNQGANLANSAGIPASPFRTVELSDTTMKPDSSLKYFTAQDWMYADHDVWVYDSTFTEQYNTGYRPSFKVTGGEYSYIDRINLEGTGALRVDFDGDFTVAPVLTYESVKQSYANYNTLSVWVMNAGATRVSLSLTVNGNKAVKTVDGATSVTLAPNGDTYQLVTFDLSAVDATSFTFGGTAAAAGTVLFDGFSFGMTGAITSEAALNAAQEVISVDGMLNDYLAPEGLYENYTADSVEAYIAVVTDLSDDVANAWSLLDRYEILLVLEDAWADLVPLCAHETTKLVGKVDATATKDGYTGDVVCTVCGETVTTGKVIPATGTPAPAAKPGDVDGNQKVDSTDARLTLQYAVKKVSANALDLDVADVDGSGTVDSTDARLILQLAVGKIKQFPTKG